MLGNFNYAIPRRYENDDGEVGWALPKSGKQMSIGNLDEISSKITNETEKGSEPWCQVFDTGYRVSKENIDYSKWNGFTFTDVDSKHFYMEVKPFNVQALLEGLYCQGQLFFKENFYCIYMTNSQQGYRILWYWDCERTEENFKKCSILTYRFTKELFYKCGDQAKDIIEYVSKDKKFRVLDYCSKSIYQGFYLTKNKIWYAQETPTGECNLDDVSEEELYKTSNSNRIIGDYKQHADIYDKTTPKTDIEYHDHYARWKLYDALIVLFKSKDKVDEEWKYICDILPEGNGHNKSFYLREPEGGNWFKKFTPDRFHNLNCLKSFGYRFKDETDYIYSKQFLKSWRGHVYEETLKLYLKENIEAISKASAYKKSEIKEKINALIKETKKEIPSILDKKLDKIEDIETIRYQYYKSRFNIKDWPFLHSGFECPKDAITYQMFIDLYYRDENNVPNIRYDILEDNIEQFSYWYESQNVQWHTLKYDNEWVNWNNHDTFSNKCNATDLRKAIYNFIPKHYGFNSVKDYWNNLDLSTADEEKLETWGIRFFDMEDTPYVRWVCKTFFIAAVAKQMVENPIYCVFPHTLFLHGKSGCGKTFFLTTMFTFNGKQLIVNDVNPNWDDKTIGPIVAKNMLIQFAESSSLKRADVNTQKEFIDRVNMGFKFQKKYENEQTTVYFRGVVCRSTNEDTLFNDISISNGDRRNLLLECKTDAMSANGPWREMVEAEKDTLWATAYKLYLDNPKQDLQLPLEMFNQLAEKQENYKLTSNAEVEEIYDEIFNRNYYCNIKGELQNEESLRKQIIYGENSGEYDVFGEYSTPMPLSKVPSRWFKNVISQKYGINTFKLLKGVMEKKGWTYKNAGYGKSVLKSWCLDKIN